MTRTRSSEKSNLKCQIIRMSWKKVYRTHAAYTVHKAYVEQAAYGAHARRVACAAYMAHTGHTNEVAQISIRDTPSVNRTHNVRGTLSNRFRRRMGETCSTHIIRRIVSCNTVTTHHPCHAAFSTMPQLGLGGPLPLLAV
jgi:hypothetical protein